MYESHIFELRIKTWTKAIFTVMNTTSAVVKIGPEKIQACMGFEPMTSAIPVQCSTNWANKPRKLWGITQNWNDESDILFQ